MWNGTANYLTVSAIFIIFAGFGIYYFRDIAATNRKLLAEVKAIHTLMLECVVEGHEEEKPNSRGPEDSVH